jgi:hypothetical protein
VLIRICDPGLEGVEQVNGRGGEGTGQRAFEADGVGLTSRRTRRTRATRAC